MLSKHHSNVSLFCYTYSVSLKYALEKNAHANLLLGSLKPIMAIKWLDLKLGAEQTILHVQQAGDHQDGGNGDEDGMGGEQTILHVPASDAGQQPTFVIQSQGFQVR